jgi:hypothetical protein
MASVCHGTCEDMGVKLDSILMTAPPSTSHRTIWFPHAHGSILQQVPWPLVTLPSELAWNMFLFAINKTLTTCVVYLVSRRMFSLPSWLHAIETTGAQEPEPALTAFPLYPDIRGYDTTGVPGASQALAFQSRGIIFSVQWDYLFPT